MPSDRSAPQTSAELARNVEGAYAERVVPQTSRQPDRLPNDLLRLPFDSLKRSDRVLDNEYTIILGASSPIGEMQ